MTRRPTHPDEAARIAEGIAERVGIPESGPTRLRDGRVSVALAAEWAIAKCIDDTARAVVDRASG